MKNFLLTTLSLEALVLVKSLFSLSDLYSWERYKTHYPTPMSSIVLMLSFYKDGFGIK